MDRGIFGTTTILRLAGFKLGEVKAPGSKIEREDRNIFAAGSRSCGQRNNSGRCGTGFPLLTWLKDTLAREERPATHFEMEEDTPMPGRRRGERQASKQSEGHVCMQYPLATRLAAAVSLSLPRGERKVESCSSQLPIHRMKERMPRDVRNPKTLKDARISTPRYHVKLGWLPPFSLWIGSLALEAKLNIVPKSRQTTLARRRRAGVSVLPETTRPFGDIIAGFCHSDNFSWKRTQPAMTRCRYSPSRRYAAFRFHISATVPSSGNWVTAWHSRRMNIRALHVPAKEITFVISFFLASELPCSRARQHAPHLPESDENTARTSVLHRRDGTPLLIYPGEPRSYQRAEPPHPIKLHWRYGPALMIIKRMSIFIGKLRYISIPQCRIFPEYPSSPSRSQKQGSNDHSPLSRHILSFCFYRYLCHYFSHFRYHYSFQPPLSVRSLHGIAKGLSLLPRQQREAMQSPAHPAWFPRRGGPNTPQTRVRQSTTVADSFLLEISISTTEGGNGVFSAATQGKECTDTIPRFTPPGGEGWRSPLPLYGQTTTQPPQLTCSIDLSLLSHTSRIVRTYMHATTICDMDGTDSTDVSLGSRKWSPSHINCGWLVYKIPISWPTALAPLTIRPKIPLDMGGSLCMYLNAYRESNPIYDTKRQYHYHEHSTTVLRSLQRIGPRDDSLETVLDNSPLGVESHPQAPKLREIALLTAGMLYQPQTTSSESIPTSLPLAAPRYTTGGGGGIVLPGRSYKFSETHSCRGSYTLSRIARRATIPFIVTLYIWRGSLTMLHGE
ncbi:hypothetical protein CCUS01_12044 [Colletotrichum cuscutae]|uniref:Uncharacterized protein n=1 Tax=Colletotrichum cuscutae TaxID=1209917 RepID=A0AAI9U1E6_9PEZI|nr:hypothetical protein CCUS01_12044 [Colletotrichum cuscutae]